MCMHAACAADTAWMSHNALLLVHQAMHGCNCNGLHALINDMDSQAAGRKLQCKTVSATSQAMSSAGQNQNDAPYIDSMVSICFMHMQVLQLLDVCRVSLEVISRQQLCDCTWDSVAAVYRTKQDV